MTERKCERCGQAIKAPFMSEAEYRETLSALGPKNRIVAWIEGIERDEGLTEAIFTLEGYMEGG